MRKDTVFDKIKCLTTTMTPQGPVVTITCRKCSFKDYNRLKKLGEAPNIHLEKFKREGWKIKGDGKKAICPNCLQATKTREVNETSHQPQAEPVPAAPPAPAPAPTRVAARTNGHAEHPRMVASPGVRAMADKFQESLQKQEVVLGLDDAYAQLKTRLRRSTFMQWLQEGKVEGAYQRDDHWWIPEIEVERLQREVRSPPPGRGHEPIFPPKMKPPVQTPSTPSPTLPCITVMNLEKKLADITTRSSIYRYMRKHELMDQKDEQGRLAVTPEQAEAIEAHFREKAAQPQPPAQPSKASKKKAKALKKKEQKLLIERAVQLSEEERRRFLDEQGVPGITFSDWVKRYLCGWYGRVDVLPDKYSYGQRGATRTWTKSARQYLVRAGRRSFATSFKKDLIVLMQKRDEAQQQALLDSLYITRYQYERWENQYLPVLKAEVPPPSSSKPVTATNPSMQAPDLRKQHNLFNLLDAHYQKDQHRYESGWTDARCAEEVQVDVAYVAQVREEVYGPIETPFDRLRTEFSQELAEIRKMCKELTDEAEKRFEKKLKALETRR